MNVAIAVAASIAAGLAMAAEGLLQQAAASAGPAEEDTPTMLRRVIRSPPWWIGLGSAACAYGFQALALTFGPLSLVQPIIVSEMLFAVPLSARRQGVRLGARAWLSVSAVVAGLALGLGLAQPRQGDPLAPTITEWAYALVAAAFITAAAVMAAHIIDGPARASVYAVAGATMLALQSALYDASIQLLGRDGPGVFTHWQAYALIAASVLGLVLVQQAYKAGPLPASLPVIDAVLPIGAIVLGLGLFGETVNTRWWGLAGAGVGVALLVAGIISLDTSRAVRKQQKLQQQHCAEPEQARRPR